jgi:hypothetical protein
LSDVGYYKFHDATYTDRLLAGEWLVSSLDYFSYMELKSGDKWIGDHTESGISHRIKDKLSWEGGNTPPEDEYMRREGLIRGGPLQGLSFVDAKFLKPEWPAHIISLCYGKYARCAHAMLEEPEPLYRYNACLEISDIDEFAHVLWGEGFTTSGTPLRELFKEPLVGPMIYGNREADISDQTPLQPGYFAKRSAYAKQNEFRIVFPHVEKWAIRDRLVFNLPRPERFLSLRLAGTPSTKTSDLPMQPDLMQETNSLYTRMRAAKAMDDTKRVSPLVHDSEMLAEMKRITQEVYHAADPHAASERNSNAIKKIMDARNAKSNAENEHSIRFEEENNVALRDLLWRWRLEKHMRLRRNIPYLGRPSMQYLESLQFAFIQPKVAEDFSQMRG